MSKDSNMELKEANIQAEKVDEEAAKNINLVEDTPQVEDVKDPQQRDSNELNTQHAANHNLEEVVKKYGGLLRKKPPLISKDHEHAFFDSADWALGKKSKGLVESLRPKLQPSPHHQARTRSVYARSASDDNEEGHNSNDANSEDEENRGQTLVEEGVESNNNSLANQNGQS